MNVHECVQEVVARRLNFGQANQGLLPWQPAKLVGQGMHHPVLSFQGGEPTVVAMAGAAAIVLQPLAEAAFPLVHGGGRLALAA